MFLLTQKTKIHKKHYNNPRHHEMARRKTKLKGTGNNVILSDF